jgi:hypothetical protein
VGFASEDDWFEYRLEHDPRFLQRVARARQSVQQGKGVKLDDLESYSSQRGRRPIASMANDRRLSAPG